MERTSKQVHQLAQSAVKQKCTAHLQSPKYHSRKRIAMNLNLVMTLAHRNILPSVHQQLWALEAALHSKAVEAIDTIKARYLLIPQMHNICILKMRDNASEAVHYMAAEFMQFLDSKGITHKHLDIKGKTLDEIIDTWEPIDDELSGECTELARIGDLEGCQRLGPDGIRIDFAACLESETISLKTVQFLVEQLGIKINGLFYFKCPLVIAGNIDNVDVFKFLLKQPGMDINQCVLGESALLNSCKSGRMEIVKSLLEQPEIDVNVVDDSGYTPIMCALKYGHMDIVKLLASHPDNNFNQQADNDEGATLLIMACQANNVEKVDWLLRVPAIKNNMSDHYGLTALHHAAIDGYLEIVERLLQHPSINVNQPDKNDYTALMFAASKGHFNIVELLLRHSSIDFHTDGLCESARWDVLQFLVERYGFDLKPLAEDIHRAGEILTEASSNGQFEFVQLLLNYIPTGMKEIDKVYGRALLGACSHGHFNVVKMLLDHPDMNIQCAKDNEDTTALMTACKADSVDIVELLLKFPQVDVNQADKDGNTALMFACKNDCVDIVKLLLIQPGIDVNLCNVGGKTPLIAAKQNDIVDLLLTHPGIDINHVDSEGRTALMRACCSIKRLDSMKLLLKYPGIDVNLIDEDGSTALILAVEYDNVDAIELLLGQPGINVNQEDDRGYTALMRACQRRIVRAVEFILGHPDIKLNQDNKRCVTAFLDLCSETDRLVISRLFIQHSNMDMNQVQDNTA